MSESYLDFAQSATLGNRIQQLAGGLPAYFNVDSITAAEEGYSTVVCEYDVSDMLKQVREEFKKDLFQSKTISDIGKTIKTIAPSATSISHGVSLLAFQAEGVWLELNKLAYDDACLILIPVVIAGSSEVTLSEPQTGRQTTISLDTSSSLMIAGRCSLWLAPQSKVVCVVLCIGRDHKKRKDKG